MKYSVIDLARAGAPIDVINWFKNTGLVGRDVDIDSIEYGCLDGQFDSILEAESGEDTDTSTKTLDGKGRVIKKDYNGGQRVVMYVYNNDDQVVKRTDTRDGDGLFEYNSDGLLKKETFHDNSREEFEYDCHGHVTKKVFVSPSGCTREYAWVYNDSGQLVECTMDDYTTWYTYGPKNQLSKVSSNDPADNSVYRFEYDDKGLLAKKKIDDEVVETIEYVFSNNCLVVNVDGEAELEVGYL